MTISRYDELERLQRLRESGALSDAEFEIEKRRILAHKPVGARPIRPIPAGPEGLASERPNWPLYAILGAIGLAVAIGLGVWLGGGIIGGKSVQNLSDANLAAPQNIAAADENMIAPPAAPDVRTLTAPEQMARAFSAAFGNAGQAGLQVAGRTIVYRPGKLIWVGDRAILISPGAATENCHACAGTLAVHYLAAAADGFQVTGSWLDAVNGAGWGAPPKWRLTGAFTQFPAIFEQGGSTGQGCTSASATLTELGPSGPVQSGPIRMAYDDSGAAVGDDANNPVQGRIANVQKDLSFDVVYSTNQPFTESWVKQGGRFVLQGGPTRVPSC
jgi:hypothetical protein